VRTLKNILILILESFPGADGKYVQRAYTPVSIADQKGHFDLVIKV